MHLSRLDPVRHVTDVPTGAVCGGGALRCFAHVHATEDGHVKAYAAPQGWGPADLQSAYGIDAAHVVPTTTPTVAVVDAYGYASLESDLAAYRAQYGLPACTTANGCLKIVNQSGQTTPLPGPPPSGDDWTIETALDVDMVSAACPSCKIVVVQATDDQGSGLFVANDVPSTLGATVVSNSWGGPEQSGSSVSAYETYFNHAGVAVFVSAGDDGYDDGGQGPDYPATSQYAIAVGGTNLQKSANTRGWTETAWTSGGSACSLSVPKPSYQTSTSCTYKATTDIAAVADPQTGVAVYNNGGWTVVGGTSAASPLVAAIWAATGNGAQTSGSYVMQHASIFNDVTSGSNGNCGNVLCNAGTGWDGPTGYGTPNATALAALNVTTGTGSGSGSGSGSGTGGSGEGSGTNGGGISEDGGNDVVGGCAAGGGSAGFAMVLALGFLIARRRRS
ncbi:MAG TPA: S53 family peptidase [Kofleriaceae bacterium]|nr:S53 family peptidase [Kofleriaceae bacterium]